MKEKITFILLYSLILICSCATKDLIFKHKLTNLKPDYFSSEDNLIYVGRITSDAKEKYDVYFNEHLFGNDRMTCRLIFFDAAGTPLGCYKVSDKPIIKENYLVFPYDEKVGNTIGIEEMIPDSIYLDGEIFLFEKF